MQTFLLATGERSRLIPISDRVTSPMLPIANRPVMAHTLELLALAGLRTLFVSLYQGADSIERYFGSGQRWNLHLHYLLQRQGWGTAGAIKRAEQLLSTTTLILPADAMLDLDIAAALAFHQEQQAAVTVIVKCTQPANASTMGWVELATNGQIRSIDPANPSAVCYADVGAYLLEPTMLNYIPAQTVFDCHSELLPALLQAGVPLYGYVMTGYWNPLQTFADFQAAQECYLHSLLAEDRMEYNPVVRQPFAEGRAISPGVWCGPNSVIHPSVRLVPPVYIGAQSQIKRNVELGPNVVIGERTLIDEGATIQRSTVLPDAYVGRLVQLRQRIVYQNQLIDIEQAAHIQVADRFLLAAIDPSLAPAILRNLLERLLALLFLLISLPLLLLLGSVLWLTMGQPPLCQRPFFGCKPMPRKTKTEKQPESFILWQLRTRRPDDTTTGFGHWLERWSLQRLPELWHVVRGDLGLVGVKPLTLEESRQVTEEWQRRRDDHQAGFTGLWYTVAMSDSDFDEICIIDSYQAALHTWRTDLSQLIQTPLAWWRRGRHQQQSPPIALFEPYEQTVRRYVEWQSSTVARLQGDKVAK